MKFFLNNSTKAHLRGLESELGESSNSIRIELNRFEAAGLLVSLRDGNKKIYQANSSHPLFQDIHNIVLKETGINHVIEKIIHRMGDLVILYLTGDFARGRDASIIELILIGYEVDREYLERKIMQAEKMVGRKVSCIVLSPEEAGSYLMNMKESDLLPLWSSGKYKKTNKNSVVQES
jgi:hypothetical protein